MSTTRRRRSMLAAVVGVVPLIVLAACSGSTKVGPTTTATVSTTATVETTTTMTATPTITRVVETKTQTATVTYTPPPVGVFSDGTYRVGQDVKPGEYRTDGHGDSGQCYWERDSDLSGSLDSTIANDNIDGPTIIDVNRGEVLKVSGGCQWQRA